MVHIEPGTLSEKVILDTVKAFEKSDQYTNLINNLEYYKGRNPHITNRDNPDDSGPDNRIPVSYARRIINIVAGYMYEPGLIQYASENQPYLDMLNDVFKFNKESLKTEQMGKQTSIHGVGYEYHWTDNSFPRFCKLPAPEVIPIYDFEVEPNLWAFIRFYKRGDTSVVMVVDDTTIKEYVRSQDRQTERLVLIDEQVHVYGQVPLVVYQNNEEQMGDFDAVEPLIDAYDTLISDSMNEFDRFAWAYLILKGMSLTEENAAQIKRKRMFEGLDDEQAVSFLTKQIDTEFIRFMADTIRQEIHRQSGLPNLDDYNFGGNASGATLGKFIYIMELFTDPKESYFTEGLYKRIELITRILQIGSGKIGEPDEIEIIMSRNTPDASLEQAQVFAMYDGRISRKTLIENFADFVKDANAEMENLKQEGDVYDTGLVREPFEDTEDDGSPDS